MNFASGRRYDLALRLGNVTYDHDPPASDSCGTCFVATAPQAQRPEPTALFATVGRRWRSSARSGLPSAHPCPRRPRHRVAALASGAVLPPASRQGPTTGFTGCRRYKAARGAPESAPGCRRSSSGPPRLLHPAAQLRHQGMNTQPASSAPPLSVQPQVLAGLSRSGQLSRFTLTGASCRSRFGHPCRRVPCVRTPSTHGRTCPRPAHTSGCPRWRCKPCRCA